MDMTNLKNNIANIKQHGDAARIAKIVNNQRMQEGLGKISPAYVRSMLNGQRKMTDEVAEIAMKYYEVQSAIIN